MILMMTLLSRLAVEFGIEICCQGEIEFRVGDRDDDFVMNDQRLR